MSVHYHPGELPQPEPVETPAPQVVEHHTIEQHHHTYLPDRPQASDVEMVALWLWRAIIVLLLVWVAIQK